MGNSCNSFSCCCSRDEKEFLKDTVSVKMDALEDAFKTLKDAFSKTLDDAVKPLEDAFKTPVSKPLEDAYKTPVSKTLEDAYKTPVSKTLEDAFKTPVSKTLEDAFKTPVSKTQEDAVSATQITGSKVEDVSTEPKTSVGAGITNMGMTCYMSAILQSLSHSHDFYDALKKSILIPTSKHKHGISDFCILRELYNHILDAFRPSPEPRVVTPYKLSGNLQLLSQHFKLNYQQDAHEYLLLLFEKLNGCDANLVKQIFGGFFLIRHKCMGCSGIEVKDEIFNHFTLSIHERKPLFDSLNEVCVPNEIVRRECTTCNGEVEWERRTSLGKSPEILILHVNRFLWDVNGKKINSHIEFCHKLVMPTSNDHYQLYALVVHEGSDLSSGHYVCFVCPDDQWYSMSDSLVETVSQDYVMKQKAYLLFYAREKKFT